ncbi:MAG: hypothetical protein IIU14_01210 [Ruminococcus sp.]|nr:hypothetical protein [Ruminococcus sp.]
MKTKLKTIIIRVAVLFFIALGLLTYFSGTIDRMLLPSVKVCQAVLSDLKGNTRVYDKYLIPKSVVIAEGDRGTVYYAHDIKDNGEAKIGVMTINLNKSDEMFYEVSNEGGDSFNTGLQLVYSTSKSIKDGDRVYVVEEVSDED